LSSSVPPAAEAGECLDFGDYRILVKPGTVPALFISAAGIGNPFADTPSELSMVFEWQGALRRLGAPEHAIFVQDRRRSWFNSDRGWRELIGFLREYVRRHRIEHTLAFGLSMGATGAILVDRELGCDTVVALSPQCVVGVGPGHDPRFQFLWEKIERIAHADLARALRPGARCRLLFSVDTPEDVGHARALLASGANVTPWAVHGPHNLGVEMHRFGRLDDFVAAVVREDAGALASLGFFRPDEALFALESGDAPSRRHRVVDLGLRRPEQLPEYCYEEFGAGCPGDFFPVHCAQVVAVDALARYAVHGWIRAPEGGLRSQGPTQVVRMRVMDLEARGARVQLEIEVDGMPRVVGVEAGSRDLEIVLGSPDIPQGARWTGMKLIPRIAI
jgi:hypothetical protein